MLIAVIVRYVSSWIDTREVQSERANLTILFDKYIPPCLTLKFKKITPIGDNSHLQMLCYLLECLLTPENTPPDCPKEWYELYFVFACIWAFGGCLFQDQVRSIRYDNIMLSRFQRFAYSLCTIYTHKSSHNIH